MTAALRARWSKKENALLYHYDRSSADGGYLADHFERLPGLFDRSLVKELEARGYDVKTLKFSIERKAP